jgi:hypothetical protein
MPMTLVETTISETSITMRLSDSSDKEDSKEWAIFEVPTDRNFITAKGPIRLPLEIEPVAVVQAAVLRYVRGAIDAEMARLSNLLDP